MFNIEQFLDLSKYATETHVARRKTNKKTGVKHFDICLMNPPYADKEANRLDVQFVSKVNKISNINIAIYPERLGFKYPSATADAGYGSEEGYDYMKRNGQKPYIKPQTYEKWKKRSFKNDISKRENMSYDSQEDSYTCHNGKKLKRLYGRHSKSKSGYVSEVTVYECENCSGCPHKEKCSRTHGNKKLYVSKKFVEQRRKSYENIMSEQGILYRMNRSIQVEGAFGVLKNDYEFQRFLLRGKTKVKLEILLLCMGYNLNKLHAKIQAERQKSYFHKVKTA